MSFPRFVFYCAIIGGWAAFVGWLLSEAILMRRSPDVSQVTLLLTAALVGGAIGGGLNLLAGAAHGTLKDNLPRLWVGLIGGLIGGALGGLIGNFIGNFLYSLLPGQGGTAIRIVMRALGWMFMGTGIGCVEGIYDRSWKKIRNGLLGGGLGGFLGGLMFEPVLWLISGNAEQQLRGVMASRATAFVILGLCIGLLVGLAQVILREAWLTVEEGFRPGRQVTLGRAETILGTSEKAQLPFIAYGAKGVEPIHLRILRQPDGRYLLEDNKSRTGTMLNGNRIDGPVALANGDLIELGPNRVRYSERYRQARSEEDRPAAAPSKPAEDGRPREARPAARQAAAKPPVGPPRMGKVEPPPLPGRRADEPARKTPPAPPRSSPAPAGFTPASKPSPPTATPRPAPPLPPSPDLDHAPIVFDSEAAASASTGDSCPICGRHIRGTPGKRLCDNCGIKF